MESLKNLNISKQLYETVEKHGHREALYFEGVRLTYNELNEQVSMLAKGLKQKGIGPGDHIGVALQNSIQLVVVFYAVARTGAVFVPINPNFKEEETRHVIHQSDITVLFCDAVEPYQNICKDIVNFKCTISVGFSHADFRGIEDILTGVEEDEVIHEEPMNDLSTIMYTSGTTGKPKGAMLTHENLLFATCAAGLRMGTTKEDVFIIPSPLFHIFGVTLLLRALVCGGKIVLMRRYSVTNTLKLIEQEKVTIHPGVPTMFSLELNSPKFDQYDLSTLRTGEIAAAPCSIELIQQIRNKMNCNILIAYGMTETSATLTMTSFTDSDEARSETVGSTISGMEVKVVDEAGNECLPGKVGEIICRGPGITSGYYKMPEATAEVFNSDGWLHTGDLAITNENDYIQVVGRKTDVIISGGFNVYPKEIEDSLHEFPGIADAAIVGISDPVLGEAVVACIIEKNNRKISQEALEKYMEEHFVKYKLPKFYLFFKEFPVMPSGKVSKMELKNIAEDQIYSNDNCASG